MLGLVTLTGLSFALAWTLLEWGGIPIMPRIYTLLAIGLLAAFYGLLGNRRQKAPKLSTWVAISLAAVPCYLVFQLIPLPLSVLQILSPARGTLIAALGPVVPGVIRAPLCINPPSALLFLFGIVSYLAVYFLVRELSWRFTSSPWRTLIPLITLGALEAAYGMFQVWTAVPGQDARSSGTFSNWDHYSGFLELIFPLSAVLGLACLRNGRSHMERTTIRPALLACLVWAVSVLIFIAIIYSLSRTGLVVALLSLFLVVILCLDLRSLSKPARWVTIGTLLCLTLLVFPFVAPEQLVDRYAGMSSTGKLVLDDRPSLWKGACSVISEFPVFGVGSGGFESAFSKYQTVGVALRVNFAHNDYLQYLAEFGVVGYSILLTALAGLLFPLFALLKNREDHNRRLVAVGCAGSLAAIALHSLVDFNSYVPATAMTTSWILGAASAHAGSNRSSGRFASTSTSLRKLQYS